MLEATRRKLEALYAGGEHRGTDGKLHRIDEITRVGQASGEALANLHRKMRPDLSIEIGLAYGFSALHILDAMQQGGYGHHVSIDPYAKSHWHGVGLAAIDDAGLTERFEWLDALSFVALPKFIEAGKATQFVFIDGAHYFDAALVDFSMADHLLDVGGAIVLDDLWMPSIQRVAAFVSTNMAWYEPLPLRSDSLVGFRKIGRDQRQWNHYVEF